MHDTERAHLEALFTRHDQFLSRPQPLKLLGLTVNLRLETPKLLQWLKAYMDPVFRDEDNTPERVAYDIDYVYADDVVQYATWMLEALGADQSVLRTPSSRILMKELGPSRYLLVEPVAGVAYLVDWKTRIIKAAYSSKTRWPGKTLSSLMVEVMTRYLEGIGYCNYHAGAFTSPRGAVIVCGKGGSGKTTLLSAAVMAGAEMIANERCFIKVDESGVHAVGFPQKVFVGLGMALNFEGLHRYALNPSTLLGPQRRYNFSRVQSTAIEKVGRLGDKFGMLPAEFTNALNGSKPALGGRVVGIVQPRISSKVSTTTLEPMDHNEQFKLMRRNTISLGRDKHNAYWLDLDFLGATPHHEALAKLPGATMHYRIKKQAFVGLDDPLAMIYDTLEKL
jgi:ABC-type cobalamin/Fe3+-siderophores transport system ATPase subunit